MPAKEFLRWSGSIGIFYILIPAYLVASDRLLSAVIPLEPPRLDAIPLRVLFAICGVVGLVFVVASIGAQVTRGRGHPFDMTGRESFSRPTQVLLTSGVYALSRNPMGFGDILLYAAITGLTGSAWSLMLQVPGYAVVVLWNHHFNERPALMERFGEAYRAYERRTPVLIPWPRRRAAPVSPPPGV